MSGPGTTSSHAPPCTPPDGPRARIGTFDAQPATPVAMAPRTARGSLRIIASSAMLPRRTSMRRWTGSACLPLGRWHRAFRPMFRPLIAPEGRCHPKRAREDSNLRPAVSAQSDAFTPGRTISSPFRLARREAVSGAGRCPPAGTCRRRRVAGLSAGRLTRWSLHLPPAAAGGVAGRKGVCHGLEAGASNPSRPKPAPPLVTTSSPRSAAPRRRLGSGLPARAMRVGASPSSPGSPRPVSGPGPSFRRKPPLYPAELRALAGSIEAGTARRSGSAAVYSSGAAT
jgi:hypothetical protein